MQPHSEKDQSTSTSAPRDAAQTQVATICRQIVDSEVRPLRGRYRRRASRHRLYYRCSGLAILLFGVSLPLLAGLHFNHRDVILSIVSVALAALTGLREFYRWDEMWSLLRRTENAISHELLRWELAISSAVPSADPKQAPRACCAATEELLAAVRTIQEAEADSFFGGMRFPQAGGGLNAPSPTS